MKKLWILSGIAMSFCLAGCNTMSDTANFANSTVGAGVKYTATAVGTGVGFVGNGVSTVLGTGAGFVTGQPVTYQKNKYNHTQKTIYYHGHQYMLKNGKYVRIH